MESLRPTKSGSWYARVQWYEGKSRKEKYVSLKTTSKVTARERFAEVEKVEDDIKEGIEFSFPWIDDIIRTKVKRFNLQDAVDKWIDTRIKNVAKSTLESNQNSIDYFVKFLGISRALESITTKDMKRFGEYLLEKKGLGRASINIHLRAIKTMFRYYLKIETLTKIPIIDQLTIRYSDPIYITDNEFQSMMELDWLDGFYKRVFLLHRDTGMRLAEPMISVLEGNWVDIPNTSKGKAPRSIELNESLKLIFLELKGWYDYGYGSKLLTPDDHISKMFKKALRSIGADESKHFHSLRHTFAVRRLIQGTSIYDLKLLMGHKSVTTTEVYCNMNLKRVAQDFPTIVSRYVNEAKIGQEDTKMEDIAALTMPYIT